MVTNNFELRSEKARSIIGKIPPILIRIGIMVITGVILVVLTLMYYIPYPQTLHFKVRTVVLNGEYYAQGELAIKDAKSIMIGQNGDCLFYSLDGDYLLTGIVKQIEESEGKLLVLIDMPSNKYKKRLFILPQGEASVLISKTPILQRVLR
ncbi:MAG: hypothetical protein ACRDD6_09835 [Tannerellaceae bacterium]